MNVWVIFGSLIIAIHKILFFYKSGHLSYKVLRPGVELSNKCSQLGVIWDQTVHLRLSSNQCILTSIHSHVGACVKDLSGNQKGWSLIC